MGLLTKGETLTWDEIQLYLEQIRNYALEELIRIYNKSKTRQGDPFTWGDEIELTLIKFDHNNKRVQLLLKAHQLLPILYEYNEKIEDKLCQISWHPEACNFVIEGIPSQPYQYLPSYLNTVEANMRLRREQVQKILSQQSDWEFILNIAVFPGFGQNQCTYPSLEYDRLYSFEQSLCYPDLLISPIHPRAKSLVVNTTARRQSKASINIPIFKDYKTSTTFIDPLFQDDFDQKENYIHLDSTTAGWGCSCLQVTFQAQSLNECIHLYDQLIPLCPIMISLSAACPIWRGFLSDIDCRWNVISQAADDRTNEEKIQGNLSSRYSSTPCYLTERNKHFNDQDLLINENIMKKLIEQNMPETLARHYAHLFVRDPLVIIKEFLHPIDENHSYHFENLNSLVWNTLRLKPPPLDNDLLGWRIEFRPMDIQMNDFENAALVVFLSLLTRVIITYGLDLTIPISQVNENMNIAHRCDSIRKEKFFFRCDYNNISQISINDIINGTKDFLGLVPLVRRYINDREDIDTSTRHTIEQYILFISKRADGTLLTNASWMREFIRSHPLYNYDSIVSEEIQYDLLMKMEQIENYHEHCPSIKHETMNTYTDLHPN